MGCFYSCLYFCQQFHDSYIRDNKPVQIAISLISGALLMVILLAIFGAFRSTHCAAPDPNNNLTQYNVLSRSWVQTVCKLDHFETCKESKALPTSLTIHSLTARLHEKEAWLRNCKDNDPVNQAELDKLKPKLEAQWPNVFVNRDNDTYWKNQWTNHGSCTSFKSSEYFEKTLKLDSDYPIQKYLTDKQIKPSNEKLISKTDFIAAITESKQITSDQFVLRCNFVLDQNSKQHRWFHELLLCVDGQANQLMPACDENLKREDNCGDEFYLVEDRTKPVGPAEPTTPTPATTTLKPTETPTTPTTPKVEVTSPVATTSPKPVTTTSTPEQIATTNSSKSGN